MSHSTDSEELLEVPGDELRAVVRDDSRSRAGEPLAGPLDDRLDIGLGHAFADLPVDDVTAAAVEQAAEVEEGPGDVDVRDVDVPVLVRAQRLLEPLALLRGLAAARCEAAGGLEDAVDAGGADRDDIGVEHHVGQPPVSLQGVAGVEVEDRLLLPALEPPIAREPGVMPVGRPEACLPREELAETDAEPTDEPPQGDLGPGRPTLDERDDLVARREGNPDSIQSSPSSFFS